MYFDKEDGIPIQCPCCKAFFMFPSKHPIHKRDQLELKLEEIRQVHPEVNELGDEEGG